MERTPDSLFGRLSPLRVSAACLGFLYKRLYLYLSLPVCERSVFKHARLASMAAVRLKCNDVRAGILQTMKYLVSNDINV